MTKENYIIYNNDKIFYNLIISKRKTMCIEIKNNAIIIRTNKFTSKKCIEKALLKNIEKILGILKKQQPKTLKNGSIIKIFGKDFILNITNEKINNTIYIKDNILNIYIDKNELNVNQKIQQIIDSYYLSILTPYVYKSFENFKNITGLFPNKVSIKKMKTRWGSCSSNKNISINLLLAKYDYIVIDYVILHELCHLIEMNHSYKFWDLVEKYMPNYKEIKKLLNTY